MRNFQPSTLEQMELLAERLLARHRIGAPPVNVDEIANAEGLDFAIEDLESVFGAYTRDEDGRGHAFISSRQHRLKQRFTKAHELCHHLIDEERPLYADGGYIRLPTGYRGKDRHWAHERFAAALLMPRAWVGEFIRQSGWQYEKGVLIDRVAKLFDVSRPASEIRLRELGHIQR